MSKCCFTMLLAVAVILASCKGSDSTVDTSNDYCYIRSVVLGNIKRKTQTLNTSIMGSNYLMTIDHRTGIIENRDSLPYGSQLDAVLVTISFDGSILSYRPKGSDGAFDIYNSTDSIDLTNTLELFLSSNDSQSSRLYTLKVNVHQQEGDSLYWRQCEDELMPFADATDMKAFTLGGKLSVLEQKATGTMLAQRTEANAQGVWEETETTGLPLTANLQTLCQQDGKLYLSTSDGSIFTSADAKDWQQTGTTLPAGLTLVEKTEQFFYALSEGKLLRSADASAWEEESLDTEATMLPTAEIRSLCLEQTNGNNRIILLGQREGSKNAVVWNKMWNESETEETAQWTYFPLSDDNTIPCPQLQHLCLMPYDGNCIAFGGASADDAHKALDALYVSKDYGITWRPNETYRLPESLAGTEGCIAGTVDNDNFIWIITNTQVWRGRLNRLGFARQ